MLRVLFDKNVPYLLRSAVFGSKGILPDGEDILIMKVQQGRT
jgi:hypothetical protein